jgi:hypothetical protein
LINKVLIERSKIKYQEYIEYLRKNPSKSRRRRFAIVKLTKHQMKRMSSISENRVGDLKKLFTIVSSKQVGGAKFVKVSQCSFRLMSVV